MRNTLFSIVLMASAILAFNACDKQQLPVSREGTPLTISATVGAPTKTAYSYDPESKEMDDLVR